MGSGGSMGIPVSGCPCPVCHSDCPEDKRFRSSALIRHEGRNFVIDMGPDFRHQAIKNKIMRLDGVLITHTHYDHVAGFDEVRPYAFRQKRPIPVLLSEDSLVDIKRRYGYLPPELTAYSHYDGDYGQVQWMGMDFGYVTYRQAGMLVHGYRFGDLGYITDIQDYHEEIFDILTGVKTLVISALRWTPSPVHFTLDDAMAFGEKVGAEKIWVTHIAHDLNHQETNERLPDHVNLAYDGLTLAL